MRIRAKSTEVMRSSTSMSVSVLRVSASAFVAVIVIVKSSRVAYECMMDTTVGCNVMTRFKQKSSPESTKPH